MLRVLDAFTIAQDGELDKTEIHTDNGAIDEGSVRNLRFEAERDEPTVRLARDGRPEDSTLHLRVLL
jgi:hypothetical protein